MESKKVFVRDATGLTREISGWDALAGNLASMGIGYLFLYVFFASLLYPGVNLPATVVFMLLPGFVFSLLYYYFSVAMPRSGGDYVFVGRVLHPSIGFMTNFFTTLSIITFLAGNAAFATTYGLGTMFVGLGLVYSSPSLIALANSISTLPYSFVISAILMSAFVFLIFLHTRVVFRVVVILTAIAILGTVVMVLAFFTASTATFVSNFNLLSGMNYQEIISRAGMATGFTLQATLTGAVFTIYNSTGFNWSAYYGGEVKNVKKSQFIGIVGSMLLFAFFAGIIYLAAYYSPGAAFVNSISYLAGTGNSAYTLPASPVLNLLVVFANPNPIIIILASLAFIATALSSDAVETFIVTRNLFAWSFDRLMPSWLAKTDSRTNSPYLAVLATWIFSVVLIILYFYTTVFNYLGYTFVCIFATYTLTSLAGIVFPYRRRDIFEAAPDAVKKRIAGIPRITLLGIAGLILGVFIIYSAIQPGVTPPPSGPPLVQALTYLFAPLTGLSALIIYAIAYLYRKSQGIDLNLAFKEIPPE